MYDAFIMWGKFGSEQTHMTRLPHPFCIHVNIYVMYRSLTDPNKVVNVWDAAAMVKIRVMVMMAGKSCFYYFFDCTQCHALSTLPSPISPSLGSALPSTSN